MSLLTLANTKLLKSSDYGYMSVGLSLAPNTMNSSSINLCGHSTHSCRSSCLVYSGMNNMSVKNKIKKTDDFLKNRNWFLEDIHNELQTFKRKAESLNKILTCRLNMYSDINFSNIKINISKKNIYELNPSIQFIEYTRFWHRISNHSNLNYTYSADKESVTEEDIINQCNKGLNVSIIYTGNKPETYLGISCIDGDLNDLRHTDPKGVIVLLKYKNAIKKNISNQELLKENTSVYKF